MSEFVRIVDPSGKTLRNDLYNSPPDVASYIIFKEGSKIKAKNGRTGQIEYEDTDAANIIQDVLDALGSNGGQILIKRGEYEISQTISLNNVNNVIISGENVNATKLTLANNANCNMFEYTSTETKGWFVLENITLYGNKSNNTTGKGLYVKYTAPDGKLIDGLLMHVFIRNFPEEGAIINWVWGWRFVHCVSEYNGSHGLYLLGGGTNAKLWGCKFHENGGSGLVIWSKQISVMGCECGWNTLYGIHCGGASYGINIIGCALYNNNKHNMYLEAITDSQIIGNHLSGAGTGCYDILIGASSSHNIIIGNEYESIVDNGTYNIIGGIGREAAGAGNPPTATNWRIGNIVRNTDDNTIWIKCYDGVMRQIA